MRGLGGFLRGLKDGMKHFGKNINLLINSVLLFIVYVVGVGLTKIVAVCVGKRFLETRISEKKTTYWIRMKEGKEFDEHLRQF